MHQGIALAIFHINLTEGQREDKGTLRHVNFAEGAKDSQDYHANNFWNVFPATREAVGARGRGCIVLPGTHLSKAPLNEPQQVSA